MFRRLVYNFNDRRLLNAAKVPFIKIDSPKITLILFDDQKFGKVSSGVEKIRTNIISEYHCISEVEFFLETAVLALYIRNYADASQKPVVLSMNKNVKISFRKLLQENTWMDTATKELALEKVSLRKK